MQQVIINEPYIFVPPVQSNFWPWLLQFYLRRYLRKTYGVHSVECRNVERLRASLAAGNSIVIAPNHCRLADPFILGILAKEADSNMFAMASWHLFKQGWYQRFIIRRMGAFSVFREGNDRQAIDTAINILVEHKRPLVMFPEGAITRHNDLIEEVMDGPAFIARQAAKRLKKQGAPGEVIIHPLAIRYAFQGDPKDTLSPVLDELETRFSWQPQRHLSLVDRIDKIGHALLALKEVEYFGEPRSGNPYERAEKLVDEVLAKLETDWNIKDSNGSAIARVKRLRTAILPDMIGGKVTPEERERRWRDLAACYYAQQISHYPRDYILRDKENLPERLVETVERFEEDFTDKVRRHEPFHVVIQVGEAIPVGSQRDRESVNDPAMAEVKLQLQTMMNQLAAERTAV